MASSSVLQSASNSAINVFDTISTTANAATKLVTGIATGANMFERLMVDMDTNHQKRSILNQANYEQELLETMSLEMSTRQNSIHKKMEQDSTFKNMFTKNYEDLNALLNPPKPE